MNKTLLFNLLIIFLILFFVFLSQQPSIKSYFKENAFLQNFIKNIFQKVTETFRLIFEKIKQLLQKYIFSRFREETEKRKENIKEELKEETEKAKESVLQQIKGFFKAQLQKIF